MLKYVVENPVRAKLVDHPSKYVLTGSTEFTIEGICAAIAGGSGGSGGSGGAAALKCRPPGDCYSAALPVIATVPPSW